MSMIIYEYTDSKEKLHYSYMVPALQDVIKSRPHLRRRAFDLGCGSGFVANLLYQQGFHVTGIDPSASGIGIAQSAYPDLSFFIGNSDEDLAGKFGQYPLVYSLETIAHVVKPKLFATRVYELLEPGGVAVISTPFHGYWKNLMLSLLNKWDGHLNTLWDGRYLSLFSQRTFRRLWNEAGFRQVRIVRVGRTQAFAKAMIAILQKD